MKNITKIGIAVIILAIIAVSILAIRGSHRNAPIESESEPVVTVTTVTSETTSSSAEKTTKAKSTETKAADTTAAAKSTQSSKPSEAAQTKNKPAETKAATVTKAAEKKDNSDSANKSDTETQKQDEQNSSSEDNVAQVEEETSYQPSGSSGGFEEETQKLTTKKDFNKYDMLSDNEEEARRAMEYVASKFSRELFNGYIIESRYGSARGGGLGVIVNLNYNQGINKEGAIRFAVRNSEEDYIRSSDLLNLAHYQYIYGSNVDFNDYLLDEDLANFINTVSAEYKEYMNGNTEPLTNELNSFFENNNPEDDYVKYYFMRCTQNPTDWYAPEIEEARQMYIDNVVSPIYNELRSLS